MHAIAIKMNGKRKCNCIATRWVVYDFMRKEAEVDRELLVRMDEP